MLWNFLRYKLFTPNHQDFSQILAFAITERLKSVFIGNIFFLLDERRTYFYSSNSNILAGCNQVWFSVLQFCLTCSESFCSQYLGLRMTQRSCFLLNICLCLLLHFQLFLFSRFKHLKSSSFISILCLGESYLLHCFHLSSLFSAFLKSSWVCSMYQWLDFPQCLFYSWLLFNFIQLFHSRFSKSPFSLRNLPSHFIQCLSIWFSVTFLRGRDILHSTLNDLIF